MRKDKSNRMRSNTTQGKFFPDWDRSFCNTT